MRAERAHAKGRAVVWCSASSLQGAANKAGYFTPVRYRTFLPLYGHTRPGPGQLLDLPGRSSHKPLVTVITPRHTKRMHAAILEPSRRRPPAQAVHAPVTTPRAPRNTRHTRDHAALLAFRLRPRAGTGAAAGPARVLDPRSRCASTGEPRMSFTHPMSRNTRPTHMLPMSDMRLDGFSSTRGSGSMGASAIARCNVAAPTASPSRTAPAAASSATVAARARAAATRVPAPIVGTPGTHPPPAAAATARRWRRRRCRRRRAALRSALSSGTAPRRVPLPASAV
jgi:hypothetical protein